jgi:hypothetical protein
MATAGRYTRRHPVDQGVRDQKGCPGWATEQRQQWSTATWAPKSSRTFDEVADHWLTLREADTSIGPNTVRADRESLAYARRAFGALPVQKLTPAALANWSATLTGKDGRILAPATKRRAIVRRTSVMAHARKMRWLTYDPSAELDSPEQKAVTTTAADDIWTPEPQRARGKRGYRYIRDERPATAR